ncbi:MAG: His-Xaa-Ser system protein HxsD [Candidatus Colwellbacteria bacterium]|nr:His-Xaa-Ser system protein HxsD [Candidatus Colwellbacteria bacterium]
MSNAVNGPSYETLEVSAKLYPLEAIYGAVYVFLDKAYFFLDGDPEDKVTINIKGKEGISQNDLKQLKNELQNELINYAFRVKISESNRKIREYIVGAALLGVTGEFDIHPASIRPEEKNDDRGHLAEEEVVIDDVWADDPLGIAVPWEDKYMTENKEGE